MITTLITTLSILAPGTLHGDPLACPVMGGKVNHALASTDYNGVRYWYCCNGCKAAFEKDPAAALKSDKLKGKTSGVFLFDPVSGARLDHDKAIKESSDFGGVRFLFASAANKAAFDKDPKKYGTLPQKEALYCAVGKEAVASYEAASGFVDHKGVRFYMCCGGCEKDFAKAADKYADASVAYVKAPAVANPKAKAAKEGGR